METEIKNAIIKDAKFNTECGLSAWITLDYGGSCQGFGGYLLYVPKGWAAHNSGCNYAGHFIYRCLQIAGVDDWSKLIGQTVRVRGNHNKIEAIGHIINDDWFSPAAEFEELKKGCE